MNVMYKYLFNELGAIDQIWKDTERSIQVPSNYSDVFLEKFFGPQHVDAIQEVFGCSSNDSVIECKDQFSHFITAFGWVCNTKWALNGAISVRYS